MKKAFGTILKRKEGKPGPGAAIKPPPQDEAYVAKFSEAPEIKNEEISVRGDVELGREEKRGKGGKKGASGW